MQGFALEGLQSFTKTLLTLTVTGEAHFDLALFAVHHVHIQQARSTGNGLLPLGADSREFALGDQLLFIDFEFYAMGFKQVQQGMLQGVSDHGGHSVGRQSSLKLADIRIGATRTLTRGDPW